jgi:chromosome segregation ATPase
MTKSTTVWILMILLINACVPREEKEQLEMENEELRAELTRAQMAVNTLEEVGTLIDSIDQARNTLSLELEAGTNYDDYLKRMNAINEYVTDTEAKLLRLENELSTTDAKNQAYIRTIARMKKDLAAQSEEISKLQLTVEEYKKENNDLMNIVDMREEQILDLEDEIGMKLEELDLLETKIQEMMKKSQMSEADSYFALGEAMEEAARRTKLAPRKKKETYREAIEYYKKAQAFGREDASEKITALEEKI